MRSERAAFVLSMALLSPALTAQVPPHRLLPAAVEAALEPVHEGRGMWNWFATFARDAEQQPWRENQDLADAMAAAAVCGLWADDPDVVYGAACHVPEPALDLADIDRYVAAVRPHLFDEDPRFDWDTFKHVLAPEQVADVLRGRPDPDSGYRQIFIADLHRSFRAEHIPLLCARVSDPDPVVRKDAFESLLNLLRYREGSKDVALDTLLAWPGEEAFEFGDYEDPATWPAYAPREFVLPEARDGLCDPRLAALLERWLIEIQNEPAHGALGAWLLRQAEAAEFGGAADAALVVALIQDGARPAPWIGVRAALRCPAVRTEGVLAALRAFADGIEAGDEVAGALARLALGDVDALRASCAEDAAAATALLAQGDALALDELVAAAVQQDPVAGGAAMEFLLDVIDDAVFEPLLLPLGIEEELGARAEAALDQLDGMRLLAMLERCPGARRRALVEAALPHLTPDEATEELLGLFELVVPDRLREQLAAWREAGAIDDADEDVIVYAWRLFVAGEEVLRSPDLDALRAEALRPGADVQEALVELAAAGDAEARRAMAEVRRRKLYGWVDMHSSVQLAEGLDLALAPYWIDELETICCRRNGASEVVQGLLGVDAFDFPEWGLRTQGAAVRAFFEAYRDRMRTSRIARRYVVGPID